MKNPRGRRCQRLRTNASSVGHEDPDNDATSLISSVPLILIKCAQKGA
ncbi:MAG: hypothetical protein JWN70_7087 [Planctomycetaceae bacterium]|nr:hypothetical protein [Planctomycetaceae bacterium]